MVGLGAPGGRDDKFGTAISKMAEDQQRRRAEEIASKVRAFQIEILSTTFDKGMAYTNVIVLGGYAGAAGIWSFTKDDLPEKATAIVATLLTISLTAFVIFEIYKMVSATRAGLAQREILISETDPDKFLRRFEELRQKTNRDGLKFMMPIWIVQLIIAVCGALGAIALLLYNFFAIIFHFTQWPS